MKRRFLSLLTAFALCLTLIPTTAFADDEERGEDVSPCICETTCAEESKLDKEHPRQRMMNLAVMSLPPKQALP